MALEDHTAEYGLLGWRPHPRAPRPRTAADVEALVQERLGRLLPPERDRLGQMPWLVSAISGTQAAGLLAGLATQGVWARPLIVHLAADREYTPFMDRLAERSGLSRSDVRRVTHLVNEGYELSDPADPGREPPSGWPLEAHTNLKAYRWWQREGCTRFGSAVFWGGW